jgi:NADH-quinone oxidoreductase subunit N
MNTLIAIIGLGVFIAFFCSKFLTLENSVPISILGLLAVLGLTVSGFNT